MTKNNGFKADAKSLQNHLDALTLKQKDITSATGALRAALKEILEKEGYHKTATAHIRKVDAMSDTARADYLRTYKPMFEGRWQNEMADMIPDNDPPKLKTV